MNLTYHVVKTEIEKLPPKVCQNLKATDDGKKFSLLMLKKLSGRKYKEISNLYTEGSGDHQVDGVYFDEEGDLLRVNIISCKYFSKKSEKISDKDVSDFLHNGLAFLIYGEQNVGDLNAKIKLCREDIEEEKVVYEGKIEYSIKFISTSKEVLSSNGKNAVDQFINEAERGSFLINYQEINIDNISLLFSNRSTITTLIPIKLSGNSYYPLVGREGFVCRLPVHEIIKLYNGFKEGERVYQGYSEFLFTDNVRRDLGLEKKINQKIYETATNPELSSDFEFYNNGLTIIYDSKTGGLKGDGPTLFMKGLQVVNGCQTVSTLVKAEADGLLCDDVYVNTKFLAKTNENDFIQSVINFTNTQNAITDRDLHSNDQIQYDIQSILKNAGYLYERKLNEYKNDDSELRIDALEAAQAYLC